MLGNATTAIFEGLMNMIAGTGEGIDFGYIGGVILTLLGLYVVSALFSYIQGFVMTGVSMRVTYNMRNEIARKSTACRSDILTASATARCSPA